MFGDATGSPIKDLATFFATVITNKTHKKIMLAKFSGVVALSLGANAVSIQTHEAVRWTGPLADGCPNLGFV